MIRGWLLALCVLLAGIVPAQDTTDTLRIVVCAPSLAEYVHEVGVFDKVVGISRFTEFPPEAKNVPAVTDMMSPGLEAIEALQPNLIFCLQSNGRVAEYFSTRAGVKVVQFGNVESFRESNEAILVIAKKCGLSAEQRAALAKSLPDAERMLAEQRASAPKPKSVLMVLGGPELPSGGITAIGRGTFLTELLELGGGENVLPASLGAYPPMSKEALLSLDPEMILFFVERLPTDAELKSARLTWAPLGSMRAVSNPHGFQFIADNRTMIPGPRALGTLDLFRSALGAETPAPAKSRP